MFVVPELREFCERCQIFWLSDDLSDDVRTVRFFFLFFFFFLREREDRKRAESNGREENGD